MQSNTSGCVFRKCSEIYRNKWLPWCEKGPEVGRSRLRGGTCPSSSSARRGARAGRELASRAETVHCPSNLDLVSPELPAALVGAATWRNPVSGSPEGPSRCSPCAGGCVHLSEAGGRALGPYTVTDRQGRGAGAPSQSTGEGKLPAHQKHLLPWRVMRENHLHVLEPWNYRVHVLHG